MAIRINKIGEKYWYYPQIFTASRRDWASRPYHNLKKLLQREKIFNSNEIIEFNRDKNLSIFHLLQQYKDNHFSINKSILTSIEENGYYHYKIPGKKILIRWDAKSLKILKKGYLPFFDIDYFQEQKTRQSKRSDTIIFIWRKNGFNIYKILAKPKEQYEHRSTSS